MSTRNPVALGTFTALLAAGPLLAHHDWPADRSTLVTLTGTVTAFTWSNPHVTIALDVQANGATEKWTLGASSPKVLSDNGWDQTTLKPGDAITAVGYRFRNGSTVMQILKIEMASGRELYYAGPPRRTP